MKNTYAICNSVPSRKAPVVTVHPVKQTRDGEESISFAYGPVQPSQPNDVMDTEIREITVGNVGTDDPEEYAITASGVVDDNAVITLAGETYETEWGDNVPIDRTFIVKAGNYRVSVSQFNELNPLPQYNESYLSCVISGCRGVKFEPKNNMSPENCNGEENATGMPGNGKCTSDGCLPEPIGLREVEYREGEETKSRYVGKYKSTSAGQEVIRSSSAQRISWSCQFGVFRGLAQMPSGRLEITTDKEFSADLGKRSSLDWRHPLSTGLSLPEEGAALNEGITLRQGNRDVNYMVDGSGADVFAIGASGRSTTRMSGVSSMEVGASVKSSIGSSDTAMLRASYTGGGAAFYDKNTGACVGYISSGGYKMTSDDGEKYVAVVRDGQGVIRQIWNTWDGLADIIDEENGYSIRIYPAAQVGNQDGGTGLFSVGGEPLKIFRVQVDELEKSVSIIEHDATISRNAGDVITTWIWENGAWSMIEGTGEGAVETRRTRTDDADEEHYDIVTQLLQNGKVAERTKERYHITLVGDLLMSRIEGYGEEGAITTSYTYDDQGRLTRSESDKDGKTRTIYDQYGRVISYSEPWGNLENGLVTVETAYRDDEDGYSNDPVQVDRIYSTQGMLNIWQRTRYIYTETEALLTVEKRVQTLKRNNGVEEIAAECVSVEETWRAGASEEFAAGRAKMARDENGVETHFTYAGTTLHGAAYTVTATTKVAGNLVPGQSRKMVRYVSSDGNDQYEESYVLFGNGEWKLVDAAAHTYDKFNRLIGTTWINGRSMSRELTCQGKLLWEINADGVRTDYSYNSARQLVETIRSATPTTPETITAFERDAAGKITRKEVCIGIMKKVTSAEYDLQGRITKKTDILGRVTTYSYSSDGLTTTITTPSGAQLINRYNTDGSIAERSGDGQRALKYEYSYNSGLGLVNRTLLADGSFLQEEIINGFGKTIRSSIATCSPDLQLHSISEFNDKGQLVRRQVGSLAPMEYAYDDMGNLSRQVTLLDEENPEDATSNRIIVQTTAYIEEGGEVYQYVSQQRNSADAQWLTSSTKILVSATSSTLQNMQIATDERGHTTTTWTEYGTGTERITKQKIPTSDITAVQVVIDGFSTSTTDHAGIVNTAERKFTDTGLILKTTDGRGNTTTTVTDVAERPIKVTNAAGDTTTTVYDPTNDNPALITNALGETANFAYDIRNRKVAEWGSGIQPAAYEYDDADRVTALTTWRDKEQVISTDPRELEGGDTTRWEYNDPTGLVLRKTYPNGVGEENTYNESNLLKFSVNARGVVTNYTYDEAMGVITDISFSAPEEGGTESQSFEYNIYAQLTKATDATGTHTLLYDAYGSQVADTQVISGEEYTLHEKLDTYGRSAGYHLNKGEGQICGSSTGYAPDGRIGSASFAHFDEAEKQFTYAYLPGSNLLQTLTMPNGMSLVQSYEEKRDLLATMSYMRGASLVVRRSYEYNAIAYPTMRKTERRGGVMNETFAYNERAEIAHVVRSGDVFDYTYDNAGNRITAQEMSEHQAYATNALNQYTDINGFAPTYDAEGNQTRLQTSTGIWQVAYNAQNRAIHFYKDDTSVSCAYDYMGRRVEKIVKEGENIISHQHYIYRGYLQIAALDMTRANQPALWYITWDPSQPETTRPLAIQKNGTWYPYGWDAAKNITEIFTTAGLLSTDYVYSPFGAIRPAGDVEQPIQWSSEFVDEETGLVYYNFRYYNPLAGRWTRRDPLSTSSGNNLYAFVGNQFLIDILGLETSPCMGTQTKKTSTNNKKKCDTFSLGTTITTSIIGFKLNAQYEMENGWKTPNIDFTNPGNLKAAFDLGGTLNIEDWILNGKGTFDTDQNYNFNLSLSTPLGEDTTGKINGSYNSKSNWSINFAIEKKLSENTKWNSTFGWDEKNRYSISTELTRNFSDNNTIKVTAQVNKTGPSLKVELSRPVYENYKASLSITVTPQNLKWRAGMQGGIGIEMTTNF